MDSHITKGIRKILEVPMVYNLFQDIVGANKARERYFKEFIQSFPGARIMDIGCGTAVLLDHISHEVEYVGFDLNKKYIDFAKDKYGDKGEFICKKVGDELDVHWNNYFDIINAHGLLHHLSDQESEELFRTAYKCLKKGGYIVTADPIFFDGQSKFAKWVISKDRGQNVRTVEGYTNIAKRYFEKVNYIIKSKEILLPYTGVRIVCYKM